MMSTPKFPFLPVTALVLVVSAAIGPVYAVTFDQKEVDQDRYLVVANPRGQGGYNLLIVEQFPGKRACWQLNNDTNQTVDLLLSNFNFTGICGRSTDSNAFSIRTDQEDLGLKYTLRIAKRDDMVVLLGTPGNRSLPELEIGRTRGLDPNNAMKINLVPGWRLTQRTYQGKSLPHLYFTNDLSLAALASQLASGISSPSPSPSPTPRPSPSPSPSPIPIPVPTPTPTPTSSPSPTPTPTPSPTPRPSPTPVPIPTPRPSPSPAPSPTPRPSPTPKPEDTIETAIRQIYREVLGREADAKGLAYHRQRVQQGRSLSQVRQDLQNSPEGRQLAIRRIYRDATGQEIDATSLEIYNQRVGQQGWTLERVRQDIVASQPIPKPTPSPSPVDPVEANVRQLYREVLGREADLSGLTYHVGRAKQGRSLALIRQDLQSSPEGRQVAIRRIYQEVTGRNIDDSTLSRYNQRIGQEGWTLERVRQDIIASQTPQPSPTPTQPVPSPSPVASQPSPSPSPTPASRPIAVGGLFKDNVYLVIIPASTQDLPAIAEKARRLGVGSANILQRQEPRGSHVAIGPFQNRGLAEQWSKFLRKGGLDARVYYGK